MQTNREALWFAIAFDQQNVGSTHPEWENWEQSVEARCERDRAQKLYRPILVWRIRYVLGAEMQIILSSQHNFRFMLHFFHSLWAVKLVITSRTNT